VSRILLDQSNRSLFSDFLSQHLLRILLDIAADDLDNFKAITDKNDAESLHKLVQYFVGSVFGKTIIDGVTKGYNDRVMHDELGSYEAFRQVFGSSGGIHQQLYVNRVLKVEYQNGIVLSKVKDMMESTVLLRELLSRYCLQVEDEVAAKFYTIVAEQYRDRVRKLVESKGEQEGVVMGILLEMFERFRHELSVQASPLGP
jgi:argonaute-like protein implicated in RNA metabolism and viral defense